MARIFTTSFQYKGTDYTALVCQVDGSISITFTDPTLHNVIPDGKVVYSIHDGIQINPKGLTPAQDLLIAVLAAIQQKGVPGQFYTTEQNKQGV